MTASTRRVCCVPRKPSCTPGRTTTASAPSGGALCRNPQPREMTPPAPEGSKPGAAPGVQGSGATHPNDPATQALSRAIFLRGKPRGWFKGRGHLPLSEFNLSFPPLRRQVLTNDAGTDPGQGRGACPICGPRTTANFQTAHDGDFYELGQGALGSKALPDPPLQIQVTVYTLGLSSRAHARLKFQASGTKQGRK